MPGGTTLSAIVVLTNPRSIESEKGPKNILLDGNLFVTDTYDSPSLALLRFFNEDDESFDQEFTYAIIVAHVSRTLCCNEKKLTKYVTDRQVRLQNPSQILLRRPGTK